MDKIKFAATSIAVAIGTLFIPTAIVSVLYVFVAKFIMFITGYTFEPSNVAQGLVITVIIAACASLILALAITDTYIQWYYKNHKNQRY